MLLQELATRYYEINDQLEELQEKQQKLADAFNLGRVNADELEEINDKIYDTEDDFDRLEVDFYTESQKYYVSTLSKQSDKLVLTYSFFNETNDEIRVRFSFTKKGDTNTLDGWASLDDGSFSFLEKVETIQLLELGSKTTQVSTTSPPAILLAITPSIDISLPDFFKSTSKDFLDNYNLYLERLGFKNYLNKDTFNSITSHFNPLLYCLTQSLEGLESDSSKNLLKSFEAEHHDIDDFMGYAKNKASEYLYTDLNINLKSDNLNSKKHKI